MDADSGAYFVAMARAEFSLADHLRKKGKLDVRAASEILFQIASGLLEVSTIVHRDLKPGNVLWHEKRWKIADFGIARFVEDATSSHTLKGSWSPLYAAPEQWRHEHATNATDIYALGCIAFELLSGKPPFATNPEKQHQADPLPAFPCADSRLATMITLMTKKATQARPSAVRIQTLFREIATGSMPTTSSPFSALAEASAKVATAAQQAEAEKVSIARAQQSRAQLHGEAQEMLAENIDRLWEKIYAQAPAAQRPNWRRNPCNAVFSLGGAAFEVGRVLATVVKPGEFGHSRWEVVSSSTLTVRNGSGRPYTWEVSLWFVKRPNETDYRWLEVGYFSPFQARSSPFSANGYREGDLAASNIVSGIQFSWGPAYIDGETENEFHDRCVWLFDKAVRGQLREPGHQPINTWPPQM